MDLTDYRNSPLEKQRTADLMAKVPSGLDRMLDIGARDGFFSHLLAERSRSVTALDLESPSIKGERIECVQGDATKLQFADDTFDLVFCAEVLEHVPSVSLRQACTELARVSNRYLLIGVPYRQDTRLGRTTCSACGRKNPPWGHVNCFEEQRLADLFASCAAKERSFVGSTTEATNPVSTALMDWAGNPYGTYAQEEPCVHCGAPLGGPRERSLLQKVFTRAAFTITGWQRSFVKPRGNWIHVLFEKQARPE